MDFKGMRVEAVGLILVAQNRAQWRALVNTLKNLWGNFFS
jgi:hypothetical protein